MMDEGENILNLLPPRHGDTEAFLMLDFYLLMRRRNLNIPFF